MKVNALPMVLLTFSLLVNSLPAAQSGLDSPWWDVDDLGELREPRGPSEFPAGLNLRVPLRLDGGNSGIPEGTPVQVHLDLGAEALEMGWPQGLDGGPTSFTLDPDSVHLIRYTTAWNDIEEDAPIPTVLHTGWLDPDQSGSRYDRIDPNRFDPASNPTVTLEWNMEEELPPFDLAYYQVYFEITENSDEDPPQHDPDAIERSAAKYWVGKGTRLFGHHPGAQSLGPTLMVIGLADDTTVTMSTYQPGSPLPTQDRSGTAGNPKEPFTVDAGQYQQWVLGFDAKDFMIESDKPVLAFTQSIDRVGFGFNQFYREGSADFIPSTDTGFLGTHFYIPPGVGTIHLIAPKLPGDDVNTAVQFTTTGLTDQGSNGQGPCVNGQGVPEVRPADTRNWCVFSVDTTDRLAEITVTNDHPVLLQHEPPQSGSVNSWRDWSQTPSILGSPVGQRFLAVTESTDQGGLAFRSITGASINIEAHHQPVVDTLNSDPVVVSPNGPLVHFTGQDMPTQSTSGPSPPLLSVPSDPSSTAQQWVAVHGRQGTDSVAQTTPFGGASCAFDPADAAKETTCTYSVQAPFVINAFYDKTDVHVRLQDHAQDAFLSDAEALRITEGGAGFIETNKPVSIFPLGDPSHYYRYLSARPHSETPTIKPGEYRGYLIDLEPSDGIKFIEASQGDELSLPFAVRNLGRWDGGFLHDTADLQGFIKAPSWPTPLPAITFTPSDDLSLGSVVTNSEATFRIPQCECENSQATIKVTGTSQGNPNMQDSFSTVVFLRQSYGVSMWFGGPGTASGPSKTTETFAPGSTGPVPIVIKNTGSGPDSFDLDFGSTLEGGWDAWFQLPDGTKVTSTDELAAEETVALDLIVTAPDTDSFSPIQPIATSQAAPDQAQTSITLEAWVAGNKAMKMAPTQPVLEAEPGETVQFTVHIENTGEGQLNLKFELIDSLPEGWNAEFAAGQGDLEGSGRAITDEEDILVDVEVADDAPAHGLGTVLLRARGANENDNDLEASAAFAVEVRKIHALTLAGPPDIEVLPGQTIEPSFTVSNAGNGPQAVQLLAKVPGDWNLTLPPLLNISPDSSADANVTITVPAATPAQTIPIQVLASSDGKTITHDVNITVRPTHALNWHDAATVLAAPGETVRLQAVLENAGNAEETVTFAATASTGENIPVLPSSTKISPNGFHRVELQWQVPSDAEGLMNVKIVAKADGRQDTITIPVEIGQPGINLEDHTVSSIDPAPGEVAFVTALLHNPTSTAVKDVTVRLIGDNETLDVVHFASIGSDGHVVAPLRWVGQAGDVELPRLEWGVEKDGGFQRFGVQAIQESSDTDDSPAQNAPSVMVPALMVALLGLMIIIRRQGGRA